MNVIICDYCGTEYDSSLSACPLCGKTDPYAGAQIRVLPKKEDKAGKHLAKKEKRKKEKKPAAEKSREKTESVYLVPKWVMILLCTALALAVLTGALIALSGLGWFSELLPFHVHFTARQAEPEPVQEPEPVAAETPEEPTISPDQYINEEDYTPPVEEEKPVVIECKSFSFTTETVTFEEAEEFYNITYVREPLDCTQEVVFTSSDETVAAVNQNGLVVAINAGTATITAVCGGCSDSCLVTCDFSYSEQDGVEKLPPALSCEDMTLFYPGEQATIVVKNKTDESEVFFESENAEIATISSEGVITAVSSGTTLVNATFGETKLSCIVRCNLGSSAESEEGGITCRLDHTDVTMTLQNEYFKLSLLNGDEEKISGLSWKSSDPAICTVDSTGIVTAVGHGTAYVSTTYEGVTYQCIVRCNL